MTDEDTMMIRPEVAEHLREKYNKEVFVLPVMYPLDLGILEPDGKISSYVKVYYNYGKAINCKYIELKASEVSKMLALGTYVSLVAGFSCGSFGIMEINKELLEQQQYIAGNNNSPVVRCHVDKMEKL